MTDRKEGEKATDDCGLGDERGRLEADGDGATVTWRNPTATAAVEGGGRAVVSDIRCRPILKASRLRNAQLLSHFSSQSPAASSSVASRLPSRPPAKRSAPQTDYAEIKKRVLDELTAKLTRSRKASASELAEQLADVHLPDDNDNDDKVVLSS